MSPTGYCCNIESGESFKKFALNCARAFGATIDMRDDLPGTPIPDKFPTSPYHKDGIEKTKEKIEKIKKLTVKKCNILSKKEYEKKEKKQLIYIQSKKDLRVKYESMLEQVNSWVPPSKDHFEMKNFMIDQLQVSMNSDCEIYTNPIEIKSGKQWKQEQLKSLEEDLKYHKKHWDEEVKRTNGRSKWVKKLKKSLEKYD